MTNTSTSPHSNLKKGFLCIVTPDRFDELKRFIFFYQRVNDLPLSVYVVNNQANAHRAKTLCAFLSPYERTCLIDIDILVNAHLDDIFALVPEDKIGIIREKGCPVLNSGVIVFTTEPMKKLCEIWNSKFEQKLMRGYNGKQGAWDQDVLAPIIKDFPYIELDPVWNWIVKDYSPEAEIENYGRVKLFHFMHANDYDRTKYKSFQIFTSYNG